MSSDIRVTGLSQTVRDLERLGANLEDLRAAFARISSEAVPIYRRVTPVRSGRLRANYRTARTKNRAVLYVGSAAVPYAKPINYGWPARNIAPADFVGRGDQLAGPRALSAVEAEINSLISRI